jgi:hypothetical protein
LDPPGSFQVIVGCLAVRIGRFQGETFDNPIMPGLAAPDPPGFVNRHLEDPGPKAAVPPEPVQVTAKDQADVLNHVGNRVGLVRQVFPRHGFHERPIGDPDGFRQVPLIV